MGEVQLRCRVGSRSSISLVDLMDGDAESGMIVRRTAVVEVVGIRGGSNACTGKESQELVHGFFAMGPSLLPG